MCIWQETRAGEASVHCDIGSFGEYSQDLSVRNTFLNIKEAPMVARTSRRAQTWHFRATVSPTCRSDAGAQSSDELDSSSESFSSCVVSPHDDTSEEMSSKGDAFCFCDTPDSFSDLTHPANFSLPLQAKQATLHADLGFFPTVLPVEHVCFVQSCQPSMHPMLVGMLPYQPIPCYNLNASMFAQAASMSTTMGRNEHTLSSIALPSEHGKTTTSLGISDSAGAGTYTRDHSQLNEEMENLKMQFPDLPTIGSASHYVGTCKPCAFGVRCRSGETCRFCHLCKGDVTSKTGKLLLKRTKRVDEVHKDIIGVQQALDTTIPPYEATQAS